MTHDIRQHIHTPISLAADLEPPLTPDASFLPFSSLLFFLSPSLPCLFSLLSLSLSLDFPQATLIQGCRDTHNKITSINIHFSSSTLTNFHPESHHKHPNFDVQLGGAGIPNSNPPYLLSHRPKGQVFSRPPAHVSLPTVSTTCRPTTTVNW